MDLLKSRAIALEKNGAPMRKNHAGRWSSRTSPVAVTAYQASRRLGIQTLAHNYYGLLYAVAVGRGIACPTMMYLSSADLAFMQSLRRRLMHLDDDQSAA